ncbi:OmpA family protein [Pseudopelagicola sp. nBUS_20]|uniref:OmpA family protein n=1 Tax=Pseudopelagicola sp. nBUS_20 TaxID=3395317 RepID=UPI003EB79738
MAQNFKALFARLGTFNTLVAMSVFGFAGSAQSVECQFCDGKSPGELVDISVNAGSVALRSQLRAYLAETYPKTGYGVFGKAWIADSNGASSDEVIRLYKQAVTLEPSLMPAWANLGYALDDADLDDEALAVYRSGLDLRGSDPFFVLRIFFMIKRTDRAAAFDFLDEAEAKEYTAPFGVDFVRGLSSRVDGDRQSADQYFERALNKGGNFEVLEALVDNRLALLASQRGDREAITDVLQFAANWASENNDAQGFKLVADKLYSELRARSEATDFYRRSYRIFPTPEAATTAFGANANYDFENLYEFLLEAEEDFPDNHELLKTLRWANENFRLDVELATVFGERSIAAAALQSELSSAVNGLSEFYSEIGEYDASKQLYQAQLGNVEGRHKRNMLAGYIDSRIAASEFSDAARLLQQIEKNDSLSASWLAQRRDRIVSSLRLQTERDRFFESYPFLRGWEQKFGESLRVTVEFATGKAELRSSAFPVMEKVADALNAPGAEDYVFLIEGHTDSVGTDAVNQPLSTARASAVGTHLVNTLGLEKARIQTVGFGSRNPLAPNDTDAGRQINRRVEIRPYGNISKPQIVVSGALDTKALDVSRDGRIAVSGSGPLQVWDLQRMVRLHELPRGYGGEISPNGRYYATGSSFTNKVGKTYNFLIYDLRTGNIVNQLHLDTDIDEISWSPFSKEVAWTDRNGYLKVMKVGVNAPDRVARIGTIRGSEEMIWLNGGRRILASQVTGSDLVVFDADTLKVSGHVAGAGYVHGIGQSHDGRYLVTVNNDRRMVIWDTNNWNVIADRSVPNIPKGISSHPSKPWVLMNDNFDSSINLALVDLSTGKTLRETTAPQGLSISFSPDGTEFVAAPDGVVTYYDTNTLKPLRTVDGLSDRGRQVEILEKADLVVSRDDGGSHAWSLTTGRRVHSLTTSTSINWRKLSDDSKRMITVNDDGQLVVFSAEDFTETPVFDVDFSVDALRVSDKYIVIAGVNYRQKDGASSSPLGTVVVLDSTHFVEVSRFDVDIVTEPTQYEDIYRPEIFDLAISDAQNQAVLTTRWQDGYGQSRVHTKLMRFYDLISGVETASFQAKKRISDVKYEADGKEVWAESKGPSSWLVYEPDTGKYLGTRAVDFGREITLSDGRVVSWLLDFVRLDDREIYFPGSMRDLEVFEDRNLGVGITSGNEIIFIRLDQMRRELTIVPKRNGEWIAYAPEGGYSASLHGTEGVFWSLGDNYVNFGALKSQFERPDLVRKRLNAIREQQDVPEVDPNVNVEVFEAPYKVSLISEKTAKVEADTYLLKLQVVKDNAELPDPEIEYTLNGRRVLKGRGFDEDAVFEGTETLGISRRFDLKAGKNTIEASLVWRNARIATQTIEVTRVGGEANQLSDKALWFFGVGISDYEIVTQNLNFAHRDAEELEAVLKSQEGVLFKEVNTRILTNEDATERQVRIEMNEFLDQAKPNDVIIVFIAGHGVTNDEQELFFITHDADIKRPFTGMAVDRFRSYLDNRPINQNAVFLLDICHSGAADGRVVAEDAVQKLASGTGAVVFASSSGSEQSFEDETFGGGHGAFTAALLEGLRGLADNKVGNRDGLNSLLEMIVFTTSRVPELTEGQQRPSFPSLVQNSDFAISQSIQ